MENSSVVIVGVGGQGTLLASRILGAIAVENNWNVKVSEVHGMAQRGGTVITFVRMGDAAVSPLIEAGGADYILAFEEMEAMRALPYLK
ncbi:MAG: 2-oxoacid:acceptor oxidoreductase family protein, partial [Clostridia bacterium]|nr:2-oxoacid:acceptor oxidoreductase family protein [Clostridia bacterium]